MPISVASNSVTDSSRWTAFAEFTVGGTEDAATFAGDYMRNDQGGQATYGWSANLLCLLRLSAGDDVGVSVTEFAGSEGGGAGVSPANWSGMWGVNLDTLEGGAGPQDLTPALFANGNTFFGPTITTGVVDLTPGLFANGNTLITESETGRVFEVTSKGKVVWEWYNPTFFDKGRAILYRMKRLDRVVVETWMSEAGLRD